MQMKIIIWLKDLKKTNKRKFETQDKTQGSALSKSLSSADGHDEAKKKKGS